jgi:putative oxidoreductase
MKMVNIIVRLIVGGVFVYAGAVKIYDPATFATDVSNYRVLPHETVNLFAITLPWVEVAAGLLLVLGIWVRASALVVTLLTLIFLAAILQAIMRGLDIRCGCFGTVEARKVGTVTLAQDVALLAMGMWLCWRTKE